MTSPQCGVKDVVISLYQTGLLQNDVLLGIITERLLDFEPSGTDVTKSMTVPKGGAVPVTITCRLGGTVFSGGTRCGIFALHTMIGATVVPVLVSAFSSPSPLEPWTRN